MLRRMQGCSTQLIASAAEAMGASCCKAAAEDGPEPVQQSFGSSRKEFARSPLKGHGSDAQFSAESTPRKAAEGSIAAPHDRYDRDTPNSNLGIESKSTTSEARSASSSTSSHDNCGPAPDPLSVSKLSTIHSASLSHPDRSPHSDASPLSHFPTGPSLASPRVNPVLGGSPTEVSAVNVFDSIGDIELPDDVFVRRHSAPAEDSDAVKVSPRGAWDEDPAEVTAALGVGSATGLTALNGFPASGQKSPRDSDSLAQCASAEDAGGPDFKVHLPHASGHEFLSDAAASAMLAQTHSIMSSVSDYDSATEGVGVEPTSSMVSVPDNMDEVDAALDQAGVGGRALGASAMDSPFIDHGNAAVGPAAVGLSKTGTTRRNVAGGVVTGIRGTGRAARGGRGRGGLTSRDRALHTAPEPGRGVGGRTGARGRGGRVGAGRRGGAAGRVRVPPLRCSHAHACVSPRSAPPLAAARVRWPPTHAVRPCLQGSAVTHLDSASPLHRADQFSSVASMPESRNMQRRAQGRGRGRTGGGGLASPGQSNSAFSLPGYQGTNSLTDSQMAELQANNGMAASASPGSQSPAHYFQAPQQFVPGAWGMMGGSPMMGGHMVMPGSPGMMGGGFSGMSRTGPPSAASPSSASSQRQGLSPELAALLGRDARAMMGQKGSHMQVRHPLMSALRSTMHLRHYAPCDTAWWTMQPCVHACVPIVTE